jgi:hypothetical protein
MHRHAVLDTAGQVQVLALGEYRAATAAIFEIDGDKRSIADKALQRAKAIGDSGSNVGDER